MMLTRHDEKVLRKLYKLKKAFRPYAAYCTTTVELTLKHFVEWQSQEQVYRTVIVPPGSTLRIVMVSRFGDIGLTEILTDDHGYGIRIEPESGMIKDLRWTPNIVPDTETPDD